MGSIEIKSFHVTAQGREGLFGTIHGLFKDHEEVLRYFVRTHGGEGQVKHGDSFFVKEILTGKTTLYRCVREWGAKKVRFEKVEVPCPQPKPEKPMSDKDSLLRDTAHFLVQLQARKRLEKVKQEIDDAYLSLSNKEATSDHGYLNVSRECAKAIEHIDVLHQRLLAEYQKQGLIE